MSIVRLRRSLAIGALCFVGTARRAYGQSGLTAAPLCARRDSLWAQTDTRSGDDVFESAARLLPGGFGGLTTTHFFLKEPLLVDSARGVARILSSCPGDTTWRRMWEIIAHAEVRQGQYDWIELRRWYATLLQTGVTGVLSWDIDEGTNRLSYGFATRTALELFRRRAEALGVPAAAMNLRVENGTRWPVR
jgi:hypothetical protein